jgi:hypothetical protein
VFEGNDLVAVVDWREEDEGREKEGRKSVP